jgi:hypothetical protein
MTEINLDYSGVADDFYTDILYTVKTVPAATSIELADLTGDNVDATAWTAYTSGGRIQHHGWLWPADITEVLGIGIHDSLPLTRIVWEDILNNPDQWVDTTSSTPDAYLHQHMGSVTGTERHLLLTFPGANENRIAYVNAAYSPQRLVNDTDVPLLPYQYHDVIVTGAITRLMENNVQVENAVIWPGLYQMQANALREYNRKWWTKHREGTIGKPYGLLS